MKRLVLIGSVALLISASAQAASPSFTCPIGGAEFSVDLPSSAGHSTQNLDFKLGGEGAISPGPVPVCPDNGFVIYRDDLSESEISLLTPYVLSDEYQAMVHEHTPYYRLAKLLDFQGRPVLEVAFTYLRASWEVDTDQTLYGQYASAAAEDFEAYLVDADPKSADYFTSHLLLAELKRRVGNFEGAKAVLGAIKHLEYASKPYPSRIIILQYELIASENREAHKMP